MRVHHYQSTPGPTAGSDGYDRVAGGKASSTETRATPIGQQRTTGHFSQTLTAGCGDTWTGLRKPAGAPRARTSCSTGSP
ncbi:Glycosyl hydrolase family 98 putative carbohydrate-binding module domain-containing protein OS=Streptomyces microflavus OX=1919 GN=Smic_60150 PE=4 SV=1 [Streptomyces microflavus]